MLTFNYKANETITYLLVMVMALVGEVVVAVSVGLVSSCHYSNLVVGLVVEYMLALVMFGDIRWAEVLCGMLLRNLE